MIKHRRYLLNVLHGGEGINPERFAFHEPERPDLGSGKNQHALNFRPAFLAWQWP
jgi:hypothetical protein